MVIEFVEILNRSSYPVRKDAFIFFAAFRTGFNMTAVFNILGLNRWNIY